MLVPFALIACVYVLLALDMIVKEKGKVTKEVTTKIGYCSEGRRILKDR